MKYRSIYNNGNKRLLVIFAGWGMDAAPFEGLRHEAYDIAVVWDYRDLALDGTLWQGYAEVCVLAWSMGVFAAQMAMPMMDCPLGRRIAVNGTPRPVDDEAGIPESIFDATLRNMDERSRAKFYRRMCGGTARCEAFLSKAPQRGIDEAVEELRAIGLRARRPMTTASHGMWDMAIIGADDAIFPASNQRRAWAGIPAVEIESPHLPDFQDIIDRFLINKDLVSRRFSEAQPTYHSSAGVQAMIAHDLWKAMAQAGADEALSLARAVIEVGSGSGLFTRCYSPFVRNASLSLWDIAEVPDEAVPEGAVFTQCDAEMAVRGLASGSVDAILSSSALQWLSSPFRFLLECKRALRPGGIIAFSTFGHDNMPELREMLPASSLVTPSFAEMEAFMRDNFDISVADENRYRMLFGSPREVLRHIQKTGVNAMRPATIAQVRRIMESYPRTSTGRCPLTYSPLVFVARK